MTAMEKFNIQEKPTSFYNYYPGTFWIHVNIFFASYNGGKVMKDEKYNIAVTDSKPSG
jgi:hypothetical protein